MFLYAHRGDFVFSEKGAQKNPAPESEARAQDARRFTLKGEQVGEIEKWLKPNTEVEALFLNGILLTISVPIKMDFKVIEAPPGLRGNTAEGGTKIVAIETGAKISVPLFINEDDIIRVNTQSGEYVERAEKGK